jgi:hypothetical protein
MINGICKYFLLITLPVFNSCRFFSGSEKVPIAGVDQDILFLSELQSVIPDSVSKEDSTLIAEDYIKKWISTELLVKKAFENITFSQKELARELREYRNSLIIYRYQNELMREKLDTSISETEINAYYENNRKDFEQNSDLVKAITVQIPRKVFKPQRVKAFCESFSEQNLVELEEFCKKYDGIYHLYLNNWVEPTEVFLPLPYKPKSITGFLKLYTTWESRDTGFYYLVSIQDYSPAGGTIPVDSVRENIKNIIINKRKAEFLKNVENDVYTEGIRYNKFKIYENDTE